MRILFVIENYLPHIGGVEVVFSQLAEGLASRGHEITILTHRLRGTKKEERINGVLVKRVSCLGSRYLFSFLAIPLAIALAKKADVVHTTTFNGAPPAWIAARLTGKRVVITVHEVWLSFWDSLTELSWISRKSHKLLEWLIYRLPFDKYVGVSKFTASDIKKAGMPAEKITHVHNAIDYALFNGKKYPKAASREKLGMTKESFFYFGYGRPGVSKGFEYLIDAVPLIAKKIPDSKLILMLSTDPAYLSRYTQLIERIKDLGILEHVQVIAPAKRTDVPMHLSAMDCVVVPSLREGFGYAAADACALGVPVVTTTAASLPEVVFGKYTLVPPKDSSALATAIVGVSKGKYKKTPRKDFSIKKNIDRYLSIYNKISKR